jgi:hypothetical protein
MKNQYLKEYILVIFSLLFIGCGLSATKYEVNPGNTSQLASADSNAKLEISVGEITKISSRIDMACRLSTVSFENGENVETYIKNALVNEFKAANIYSEASKRKLSGNIDYINLYSFNPAELLLPGIQSSTDAKWSITMTFKGDGIEPFTIPSVFLFPLRDGFFDFGDPCDNPSKQFSSAVANLIKILVNHPSFKEFLAK